jgi:large subunit GTPase 1
VKYAFFSAANSKALQEARLAAEQALMQPPSNEEDDSDGDTETNDSDNDSEFSQPIPILDIPASARAEAEASVIDQDPRTRVLSVLELEKLFIESAPDLQSRFYLAQNLKSP